MPTPKRKVGDKVLLPRKPNFNPRFDRDEWTTIVDIRIGKAISYLCVNGPIGKPYKKQWMLESILRDMGGNAMFSKEYSF